MENLLEIRIRAFQATRDPKSCAKFLLGHKKVLEDWGIENITTNTSTWPQQPGVFCIVAERTDNDEIIGGIRVHLADGKHPLPVEDAVGALDEKVFETISSHLDEGTGEICALWNSKSVAGRGISMLLLLSGISIVNQLKLQSLFTICADYTMPMVTKAGFVVEDTLGDDGKFVYPNQNYIAQVLRKMNAVTLETAEPDCRKRILDLRETPVQSRLENGKKGSILASYQLALQMDLPQNRIPFMSLV